MEDDTLVNIADQLVDRGILLSKGILLGQMDID
jgi:hypothetical protein